MGDLGIPLPFCLSNAVKFERLDLIDVLLEKADLLGKGVSVANCFGEDVKLFSPFYCLVMAVDANKPVVFKHLLMNGFQVQVNLPQYELFAFQGRRVTLLEFILFHDRAEMHKLLTEKISKAINSGEYGVHGNQNKKQALALRKLRDKINWWLEVRMIQR